MRKCKQWRQRESQRDCQSRYRTDQEPVKSRSRQLGLYKIIQQQHQSVLRDETEQRAHDPGNQGKRQQLRQRKEQHIAVLRAHALHQCDTVEMAGQETPARHRHGHPPEQHAHQGGQHQETLGAFDG